MTLTACRLTAAEATTTVVTDIGEVVDWVRRYFTPWWTVTATQTTGPPPGSADGTDPDAPVIEAVADPATYELWAKSVLSAPEPAETEYVRSRTYSRRDGDRLLVVTPEERIAYQVTPGRVRIVGTEPSALRIPAARVARTVVWGRLERAGWTLLHASAVVGAGDRALLSFGGKGAGKTTTALMCARRLGLRLLANDRVFARPEGSGVRLLTWASVTSVGLGLLAGLGLYDGVRERLLAGEPFHPAQDPLVLEALRAGTRTAVFDPTGREMKVLVAPDRLAPWLGVEPVGEAEVGLLLFPAVAAGRVPELTGGDYRIGAPDLFTAGTEDSYPDVFGVRRLPEGAAAEHHRALLAAFGRLPRRGVRLGHEPAGNEPVLRTVAGLL
ncbi:hypothetical protein POF50_024410 [Streptomyces sp. SL13]|uniref:Serine kinase n=1 Tax=Streptantibioticus silvisoli TaxID=2705255 RepID=A0AA90H2Y2_9ACTN|nr:hypothetical protein [Streptantibioticus silvisoli]MDI5972444.1 hypothetical protein [Streptantibioticus silvisoli]